MRLQHLLFPSNERGKLWEGHSPVKKAEYLYQSVAHHLGRKGTHLDLGCGDGEMLSAFESSSQHRIGIDLDDNRLSRCRQVNLSVIRADLREKLPLADSSVDVATLISVLEHVETPVDLVAEVHRVLAPGGVAVVQIPNPRFIVDLHYFLPFYGWIPERFRAFYRRLMGGESSGIVYYTNSIGRREILQLFRGFQVELNSGFFYPREVAPYWARPFYAAFVATGLAKIMPTGFLFVFRRPL